MLRIGITGGIGSGKSVVAKIIESLNYPVFYSDKVAKQLVVTNPTIQKGLIDLFGADIFIAGRLDKVTLANHIFTNEESKRKVNALIHPEVRKAFDSFAVNQKKQLVFNEAAIIFETGAQELYDKVILVVAPKELRISRVQNRDHVSKDRVLERMGNQWSDDRKKGLADYLIVNDDQQSVIEQVEHILKDLIR